MEEKDIHQEELEQKLEENSQKLQEMEQKLAELEKKGKKRKGWKTALIVVGVIAAVIVASALVLLGMMNADKESPAMAEKVLQAIVDGDGDAAYALMYPGLMEREDFVPEFDQICQVWEESGGGDTFSMKRRGWGVSRKNGVSQYTANYEVTSGNITFDMELVRAEQGDTAGMLGFHISLRLPERVPK